jgi:hypothetical protein
MVPHPYQPDIRDAHGGQPHDRFGGSLCVVHE